MCGIAGFQGEFENGLLERMSSAVAHRGPDGASAVHLPGRAGCTTGLAHRRLAIIDLSAEGCQPMTVRCACCGSASLDDLALVFNGEIYNFPQLRAELRGRGHTFHSRTDSEVLLHLYAEEGVEMVRRLNGIFAFAIHDARASGRPPGIEAGDLFVARDHLGVKPFYYAFMPRGFLFASELKALLQDRELPRDLDLPALHQTLAYLWTPAPRTLLRGVQKLRPGFAMVVRRGSAAREWCFYDLPYGREPLAGSEDDLAADLRMHLERAVERQLVSDVEVGAFLSGGLDSSAVVAMMRRARPDEKPLCYTIGFSGDGDVEGNPADLPYARKVASALGVRLRPIVVGPEIIEQLQRMIWLLDEPQADPAPINALLIAEAARRDGVKVLLSGAGGDDIFSGYRRHRAAAFEPALSRVPAPARALIGAGARAAASGRGGGMHSTWARRAAKMLSHVDLPADRRMVAHFWWSNDALRRSLYSPATARALASEDAAAPLLESLARIPDERSSLNRMLYLEGKHFLADHNLNYTDKTGMASGVEVRVPFLDLDLVDFATRLPPGLKQRGGVGKYLFKRAMEPLLPHEVIYRGKSGFGAPLRRWLRHELRGAVEDVLSPISLRNRGVFDPAAVVRLIEMDRSGRVDGSYTIFALMCTEIWCRMFLDGQAP